MSKPWHINKNLQSLWHSHCESHNTLIKIHEVCHIHNVKVMTHWQNPPVCHIHNVKPVALLKFTLPNRPTWVWELWNVHYPKVTGKMTRAKWRGLHHMGYMTCMGYLTCMNNMTCMNYVTWTIWRTLYDMSDKTRAIWHGLYSVSYMTRAKWYGLYDIQGPYGAD